MGDGVAAAVRSLRRGELVVYPTDTVLGLGALAGHPRAVRRLLAAKGRSSAQPISVCVSSTEEIERFARVSPAARRFLRRHLPGPFTVLLAPSPAGRREFAPGIGGAAAIGFRVPDHPVARELARRAGPVTATSANRHGRPPARSARAARRTFGALVACYLSAVPKGTGTPSTVVDLTGAMPREIPRRS
jgi:L-threonylcarbamoyladenylate synthase